MRSIEEVCDRVTSGGTPSRKISEFYSGGVWPWVKTQELHDGWLLDTEEHITEEAVERSSAKVLPPNTVLMAMYGATVGKLAILSREMTCNQACCALIADSSVADYRFLYYLLLNARPKLVNLAVGAAQQNLSATTIKSLRFRFPPLPEQCAIASILGALDNKIDLNRKMSVTLEAMARALFKSWFVDFDPVRSKVDGRGTGLPSDVASLFPDSFQQSEIGEIPSGWQVTCLGEQLVEFEVGSRPKGGIAGYSYGVPSIGAESIVGLGVFDYSKTKYVPHQFFAKMSKGHVKSRDVLLYKDGGRPGQFEPHVAMFGDGFPFKECAINEHVYRMRATDDIGQIYLYFWLSTEAVMEEMRVKGTGVAVPGLNSTQLRSLTVLVPNAAVIRAYERVAESLVSRVLACANESRTLQKLRDSLLPKLISGEIRVTEAERIIAKSA